MVSPPTGTADTPPLAVALIGGTAALAATLTVAGIRVASVGPGGAGEGFLVGCDAIIVATPVALTPEGGADTAALEAALRLVADAGRPHRPVVLTGRVPPGITRSLAASLLAGGPTPIAYSPEPATADGPRVVGGIDAAGTEAAVALFARVGPVTRVGSPEAAELCGLLPAVAAECRAALGREWADVCAALGADPNEVFDTTGLPGFRPGLGGRSPAVALFAWGARRAGATTRLADAAGESNAATPTGIVEAVADALNIDGRAVRGSRILVVGSADPEVGREIVGRLVARGAVIAHFQPGADAPTANSLAAQDCVLVLGDDPTFDWPPALAATSRLVNACGIVRGIGGPRGAIVRG